MNKLLNNTGIEDQVRKIAEEAVDDISGEINNGNIKKEEGLTGALTIRLNNELQASGSYRGSSVDINCTGWEIKDEPTSGADLGIRCRFVTENGQISLGCIVQAKIYGKSDGAIPYQCEKMLSRTEEAYLMTYSDSDVLVTSALPLFLMQATGNKYTKFNFRPLPDFLMNIIDGFHGDPVVAENIEYPSEISVLPERLSYILDIVVDATDGDPDMGYIQELSDHYQRIDRV